MTDAVLISMPRWAILSNSTTRSTYHRFANKEQLAKTLAEYQDTREVFLPNGQAAPLSQWAVPRALWGETATNAEYILCERHPARPGSAATASRPSATRTV